MYALTITQPWASLIILGAKKIETRTWRRHYTGPMAIHAGSMLPAEVRSLMTEMPMRAYLLAYGLTAENLPLGAVLGTVALTGCVPTAAVRETISAQERDLGNFREGRWAWLLGTPASFAMPVPARGMNGLWYWNEGLR